MACPPPTWYGGVVVADPREEPDDAAWVQAMARGDQAAIGLLYDLHAPLLLSLVRRIVVDAGAAEDLVHDVFLEAWRRAADYDSERGSVRTWLALRARSRAIDYRKSAEVARRVPMEESRHLGLLASSMDDASMLPDHARVRRMLVALPEDHQHVLYLGYFEGLSSSEIAERVGIPIGTVKSRVASALSRLRAVMNSPEDG